MSPEEYFDALCETEAGQFVYRTVDDVAGVYQVRPRNYATDFELEDLYVLEDPYHYNLAKPASRGGLFLGPGNYQYWETSLFEPEGRWKSQKKLLHKSMFDKPGSDARFISYQGYNGRERQTITKAYVQRLKSQYGYVWRGIRRPFDRDNAIAGGELAVVDLETNEIIAIWRGFLRSSANKRKKVWWLSSQACPITGLDGRSATDFIKAVLRPVNPNSLNEG